MATVLLVPFESIEKEVLGEIERNVSDILKLDVRFAEIVKLPSTRKRGEQLNAEDFIPVIHQKVAEAGTDYGLGITDKDLYIEELDFVFGLAYRDSSVIALARLRSEDKLLFLKRTVKEAVHELGHLLGLNHCPDEKCVMHFSNNLADTDYKNEVPCKDCKEKLRAKNA